MNELKSGLVYTDHAIVRILERHLKIDIQELIDDLFSENAQKAMMELRSGDMHAKGGELKAVIKNGAIVTIVPTKKVKKKSKKIKFKENED